MLSMVRAHSAHVAAACCATVCLAVALFSLRKRSVGAPEFRIAAALLALIPLAMTGHVSMGERSLRFVALISIELHVLSAVSWTGGLLAVMFLLRMDRILLATGLPRFSRLATA